MLQRPRAATAKLMYRVSNYLRNHEFQRAAFSTFKGTHCTASNELSNSPPKKALLVEDTDPTEECLQAMQSGRKETIRDRLTSTRKACLLSFAFHNVFVRRCLPQNFNRRKVRLCYFIYNGNITE